MVRAFATLRFSAQKLRAIGLIACTACSNGTEGRRRNAQEPRRLLDDGRTLRRFVVHQMQHAQARREELLWSALPERERSRLLSDGVLYIPSPYGGRFCCKFPAGSKWGMVAGGEEVGGCLGWRASRGGSSRAR